MPCLGSDLCALGVSADLARCQHGATRLLQQTGLCTAHVVGALLCEGAQYKGGMPVLHQEPTAGAPM